MLIINGLRKGGLEPPRYCYRQPLKLVRLPIPPLPQVVSGVWGPDSLRSLTVRSRGRPLRSRVLLVRLEPDTTADDYLPCSTGAGAGAAGAAGGAVAGAAGATGAAAGAVAGAVGGALLPSTDDPLPPR